MHQIITKSVKKKKKKKKNLVQQDGESAKEWNSTMHQMVNALTRNRPKE